MWADGSFESFLQHSPPFIHLIWYVEQTQVQPKLFLFVIKQMSFQTILHTTLQRAARLPFEQVQQLSHGKLCRDTKWQCCPCGAELEVLHQSLGLLLNSNICPLSTSQRKTWLVDCIVVNGFAHRHLSLIHSSCSINKYGESIVATHC